jgi:CDP-diacylglycerol--glycerol-3-phosphate 3-phosphatidyltransferase
LEPQPRFWNVPNLLTLSRLALGVVVFGLIAGHAYLAALAIFGLAALTDALDGFVARWLNQTSVIGRQLDPLIDKVLVAGVYIFLLPIDGTGLAAWMVTVVVVRELLIQGLRSHLEGQGQAFGAKSAGKLKTVLQCASISAILACLGLNAGGGWLWARDILTWSAIALTIYSGLGYLAAAVRLTRSDAAA